MTVDPWETCTGTLEFTEPSIAGEHIQNWPAGALEELRRLQLLFAAAPMEFGFCDECDEGGVHEVYWEGPENPLILCPQIGPCPMDADRLRLWEVNLRAFTQFLANGIEARGLLDELIPDQLWRLGKIYLHGAATTVFFARELKYWNPRQAAWNAIERFSNALVIVPEFIPLVQPHPIVTLREIAHWNGETIEFDLESLASQVRPRERRAKKQLPRDASRISVRQRLKRELEQHLASACEQVRWQLDQGQEPTLLPCPTRAELARRCGTSPATVTRCFQEVPELERLWNHSLDLLHIIGMFQRE